MLDLIQEGNIGLVRALERYSGADLDEFSRFNGKRVRLHAIYSATWEGAWLSENQCDAFGQLVLPWGRFSNRYGFDDVVRASARNPSYFNSNM